MEEEFGVVEQSIGRCGYDGECSRGRENPQSVLLLSIGHLLFTRWTEHNAYSSSASD